MAGGDAVRHYRVVHRITHEHPESVAPTYGRALMLPRDLDEQRVHHAHLHVDPAPHELRTFTDPSGNTVSRFHVRAAHTRLEVVGESLVSVDRPFTSPATLPQLPWDQVVGLVRGVRTTGRPGDGTHPSPQDVLDITSGALPSELVPLSDDTQAFALDTFAPGQPLARAVVALSARLRRIPGPRSCHDDAHLMLSALRSLGLAALLVSGYRAGDDGTASLHAWVAVWFPGVGWVHLDPATDSYIDDHHLILGWGRDLNDVTPLHGITYGGTTESESGDTVEMMPLTVEELAVRLGRLES